MSTRMVEERMTEVRQMSFTKQNKCYLTYNTVGLQNINRCSIAFDTFRQPTSSFDNPANIICVGYKQSMYLTTSPVTDSEVTVSIISQQFCLVSLHQRRALSKTHSQH